MLGIRDQGRIVMVEKHVFSSLAVLFVFGIAICGCLEIENPVDGATFQHRASIHFSVDATSASSVVWTTTYTDESGQVVTEEIGRGETFDFGSLPIVNGQITSHKIKAKRGSESDESRIYIKPWCLYETSDCSQYNSECVEGICNLTIDECVSQNLANGTSCSDGNTSTINDVCENGVCSGEGSETVQLGWVSLNGGEPGTHPQFTIENNLDGNGEIESVDIHFKLFGYYLDIVSGENGQQQFIVKIPGMDQYGEVGMPRLFLEFSHFQAGDNWDEIEAEVLVNRTKTVLSNISYDSIVKVSNLDSDQEPIVSEMASDRYPVNHYNLSANTFILDNSINVGSFSFFPIVLQGDDSITVNAQVEILLRVQAKTTKNYSRRPVSKYEARALGLLLHNYHYLQTNILPEVSFIPKRLYVIVGKDVNGNWLHSESELWNQWIETKLAQREVDRVVVHTTADIGINQNDLQAAKTCKIHQAILDQKNNEITGDDLDPDGYELAGVLFVGDYTEIPPWTEQTSGTFNTPITGPYLAVFRGFTSPLSEGRYSLSSNTGSTNIWIKVNNETNEWKLVRGGIWSGESRNSFDIINTYHDVEEEHEIYVEILNLSPDYHPGINIDGGNVLVHSEGRDNLIRLYIKPLDNLQLSLPSDLSDYLLWHPELDPIHVHNQLFDWDMDDFDYDSLVLFDDDIPVPNQALFDIQIDIPSSYLSGNYNRNQGYTDTGYSLSILSPMCNKFLENDDFLSLENGVFCKLGEISCINEKPAICTRSFDNIVPENTSGTFFKTVENRDGYCFFDKVYSAKSIGMDTIDSDDLDFWQMIVDNGYDEHAYEIQRLIVDGGYDIIVGRWSVNNGTDLESYLYKTIQYSSLNDNSSMPLKTKYSKQILIGNDAGYLSTKILAMSYNWTDLITGAYNSNFWTLNPALFVPGFGRSLDLENKFYCGSGYLAYDGHGGASGGGAVDLGIYPKLSDCDDGIAHPIAAFSSCGMGMIGSWSAKMSNNSDDFFNNTDLDLQDLTVTIDGLKYGPRFSESSMNFVNGPAVLMGGQIANAEVNAELFLEKALVSWYGITTGQAWLSLLRKLGNKAPYNYLSSFVFLGDPTLRIKGFHDLDTDDDGVPNLVDSCPSSNNPHQSNCRLHEQIEECKQSPFLAIFKEACQLESCKNNTYELCSSNCNGNAECERDCAVRAKELCNETINCDQMKEDHISCCEENLGTYDPYTDNCTGVVNIGTHIKCMESARYRCLVADDCGALCSDDGRSLIELECEEPYRSLFSCNPEESNCDWEKIAVACDYFRGAECDWELNVNDEGKQEYLPGDYSCQPITQSLPRVAFFNEPNNTLRYTYGSDVLLESLPTSAPGAEQSISAVKQNYCICSDVEDCVINCRKIKDQAEFDTIVSQSDEGWQNINKWDLKRRIVYSNYESCESEISERNTCNDSSRELESIQVCENLPEQNYPEGRSDFNSLSTIQNWKWRDEIIPSYITGSENCHLSDEEVDDRRDFYIVYRTLPTNNQTIEYRQSYSDYMPMKTGSVLEGPVTAWLVESHLMPRATRQYFNKKNTPLKYSELFPSFLQAPYFEDKKWDQNTDTGTSIRLLIDLAEAAELDIPIKFGTHTSNWGDTVLTLDSLSEETIANYHNPSSGEMEWLVTGPEDVTGVSVYKLEMKEFPAQNALAELTYIGKYPGIIGSGFLHFDPMKKVFWWIGVKVTKNGTYGREVYYLKYSSLINNQNKPEWKQYVGLTEGSDFPDIENIKFVPPNSRDRVLYFYGDRGVFDRILTFNLDIGNWQTKTVDSHPNPPICSARGIVNGEIYLYFANDSGNSTYLVKINKDGDESIVSCNDSSSCPSGVLGECMIATDKADNTVSVIGYNTDRIPVSFRVSSSDMSLLERKQLNYAKVYHE